MKKTKKIIAGGAVAGVIAGAVIVGGNGGSHHEELEQCEKAVELPMKYERWQVASIKGMRISEKLCLTQKEYSNIKGALKQEYANKEKDYDFDINNRDILFSVLTKEIKDKKVKPPFHKEKLINLLN